MDPTQPGRAPPLRPPRGSHPPRKQKLPSNRSATGGSRRQRAVSNLTTHENLERDTNNNGTAETVRLRSGSLDTSQPPPMTGTNQQYQRPRWDSRDSLYSGAIEGCSRDHHPECYPELWQKADKSITSGHDQDRITTDLAGQPQPPPSPPTPPLLTPSSSTSSSSNGTNNSGGYKTWLIRNFARKLLPKAGAEKAAAANKPSRKGKESPLTMEDRMFFMGIRPRPEDEHEEKDSSPPPPPPPSPPPPPPQKSQPPAGTASSSAEMPVIGGFMTYPQIGGFHDPARTSGSPLVVANPDPGSEAERVRDDAARGRRSSGNGHRSSSAKSKSKSKSKAKGSGGGRLGPKDRLRTHAGVPSRIHTAKRY